MQNRIVAVSRRMVALGLSLAALVINRWDQGIRIEDSAATGNRVSGNYLGTDTSGTEDVGNLRAVYIRNAPNNTIGGATIAERNAISGNDEKGVAIVGADATGNKVTGNYIEVDKTGTADLGNSDAGVLVTEASNTEIGGTIAGAGNVISANDSDGVVILGATGNRVLSNSIFANAEEGIDLGGDGPTANDPDDTDTGANNLQNYPVLYSAKKGAAGTTTVRGTLDGTANKTFRVQFFSNPAVTDEGQTLLGSATVSTDGAGDASFTFSTKKTIGPGRNITATGPGGNTSEFSTPSKVVSQ